MASAQDLANEYEVEAWRRMLATEQGRAVIYSIMLSTGWPESSFAGDNAHTNFGEGRRSVAMEIQRGILRVDRSAFTRMISEHEDRLAAFEIRAEDGVEDYMPA